MYKQTIPIPSLPTNESACFTAACSALFSVFVSFAYPTCSLYPLSSYPFPSVLVACSLCSCLSSHIGRFLAVQPPLFSQCSRKPSVFSVFLILAEAYAATSFFRSILSRSLFSTRLFASWRLPRKRSAVFSLTPNHQSTVTLDFSNSRSVHISPRLISRSILLSFSPSFYFFPFSRSSTVQIDLSCYQHSKQPQSRHCTRYPLTVFLPPQSDHPPVRAGRRSVMHNAPPFANSKVEIGCTNA